MTRQAPHCTRAFYDEVVAPLKARAESAEAERDALRAALAQVDTPYPLAVFPERSPEQRDAIFAAMRSVDKYATEWFYAHVARDRGRVARELKAIRGALANVEDNLYRFRHFGKPTDLTGNGETYASVIEKLEHECNELRAALGRVET